MWNRNREAAPFAPGWHILLFSSRGQWSPVQIQQTPTGSTATATSNAEFHSSLPSFAPPETQITQRSHPSAYLGDILPVIVRFKDVSHQQKQTRTRRSKFRDKMFLTWITMHRGMKRNVFYQSKAEYRSITHTHPHIKAPFALPVLLLGSGKNKTLTHDGVLIDSVSLPLRFICFHIQLPLLDSTLVNCCFNALYK